MDVALQRHALGPDKLGGVELSIAFFNNNLYKKEKFKETALKQIEDAVTKAKLFHQSILEKKIAEACRFLDPLTSEGERALGEN